MPKIYWRIGGRVMEDINTYISECNDTDELQDIVDWAMGRLKLIEEE